MDTDIKVLDKLSKKVSSLTVDDIALYCEKAGITVETLCDKGLEFLNAKKSTYDIMTNETTVEPLYNVQLKAWFGFLELLKLVSREQMVTVGTMQHSMAPEDISRLEILGKELKGLEVKLATDKVQQGTSIDADFTAV